MIQGIEAELINDSFSHQWTDSFGQPDQGISECHDRRGAVIS
jgi:hypothetical protein